MYLVNILSFDEVLRKWGNLVYENKFLMNREVFGEFFVGDN